MSDNADVRNFFCVRALSFGVASFARARVALSRGFHTGNSFLFLNGGKMKEIGLRIIYAFLNSNKWKSLSISADALILSSNSSSH